MLLPKFVRDHTVIQYLISQTRYDEKDGAIFTKSVMFSYEEGDVERPLAYVAHPLPKGGLQARCVNHQECGGSFVLGKSRRRLVTEWIKRRPHSSVQFIRRECYEKSKTLLIKAKNWQLVDALILETAKLHAETGLDQVESLYGPVLALEGLVGDKNVKKNLSAQAKRIANWLLDHYIAFNRYPPKQPAPLVQQPPPQPLEPEPQPQPEPQPGILAAAMAEAGIPDLGGIEGVFGDEAELLDPYLGDLDGLPPTPEGSPNDEVLEYLLLNAAAAAADWNGQ